LKFGVGRREVHGVAYIGVSASIKKERIEHRHSQDTQGIRGIHERIEGQWGHRWCRHTKGAPATLGPPPGLKFCPGA